jgi:hypothetical protein
LQLLVAGYSAHNVFASGSGVDVCLDHHGGAPHNNLWTDIDLVRDGLLMIAAVQQTMQHNSYCKAWQLSYNPKALREICKTAVQKCLSEACAMLYVVYVDHSPLDAEAPVAAVTQNTSRC